LIHPDKFEHPDANKAQVLVNQAMTTLESPIARSEYHMRFEGRLKKHESVYARKQKRSALSTKLKTKVAHTIAKKKKGHQGSSIAKGVGKGKADATVKKTYPNTASTPEPDACKTGKEEQEQSSTDSAAASKSASKVPAEPPVTEKPTKPETPLKFWEVSGFQVRPFKNWIAVRISGSLSRKFQHKEWQNENVAMKVATEFAKQVSKKSARMKIAKTKKEKFAYLKENGINCATGKETIVELELLLQEAGHGATIQIVNLFASELQQIWKPGVPRNTTKYSNIMSYVQIVFPNLFQFTTGIILDATTVAGQGT
jgi:hypothetical protein